MLRIVSYILYPIPHEVYRIVTNPGFLLNGAVASDSRSDGSSN
jgi:hypothetical protein